MNMRRLCATAFCVTALAAGSAAPAFAGEVKGPPGTLNNTNETGALDHANSACAASGLNDFDTTDPNGQLASQVQTAADSWKYYGLPKGAPGKLGLCKGGTGER
jgi:ABC-type sugar transport system substrate-binding protein